VSASADIVWLRDDFRLDDQPSIHAVGNRPALFVYVHDEKGGGARPLGGAAKWRLAESLTALESELSARGARLDIVKGDAEETSLRSPPQRRPTASSGTGGAKALDARVEKALRSSSSTCSSTGGAARNGSGTRSSTPSRRTTRSTGNGSRA